ncbi:IS21-like element helper ATPase IstB [Carnobacterium sp.]|uniref:IS21-like element helper ATPase IstB n=1 Tax=Carnobacterium sp. TaxID=48221 RepID=UPI003890374D
MKDLIARYCRELRLGSRLSEEYQKIEAVTHEEFLAKLLEHEVGHREVARTNRLIKNASFDVIKTFENYDFSRVTLPASAPIEIVRSGSFIQENQNLILYGPAGVGKSHLATAIGVEQCRQGKEVKFYRTAALVNELIEAQQQGRLAKFLKTIEKADLLICDEWGFLPLSHEGAQLLFQVVSACYERKSLILTTNLEFSKWSTIFYDEKMTAALIDRLVHHSHLIVFQGPSYRYQHSSINL